MIMEWTVRELMNHTQSINHPVTVSREQYDQWAREFVFDTLRQLRYGQSFCNHFDINDNILFYSQDTREADDYIRKVYVR
jgi:hypothetical protein